MPLERGSKASGRLGGAGTDSPVESESATDALPAYRSGLDTLRTEFCADDAVADVALAAYDPATDPDT
jgi:hypothetical protein